jgi:hypothetical protein
MSTITEVQADLDNLVDIFGAPNPCTIDTTHLIWRIPGKMLLYFSSVDWNPGTPEGDLYRLVTTESISWVHTRVEHAGYTLTKHEERFLSPHSVYVKYILEKK